MDVPQSDGIQNAYHSPLHFSHVFRETTLEILLQLGEEPKITTSKVWTVGKVRGSFDAHLCQVAGNQDQIVHW